MTTPAWRDCDRCNYDLHVCPGCGESLPHGIDVCDVCREAGHTLTTDTTALQERLWEAVAEVRDQHPRVFNDAPTVDVIAAVLPIIAAEVREAKAEAWDEGAQAQADTYGGQIDTGPNPYEETP